MKKTIRINKSKVSRLIKFRFGTIQEFATMYGVSRMRVWQIMNETYTKITPNMIKISNALGLKVDEIIQEE